MTQANLFFYKNTINSQSSIYNMNFSKKYPHIHWWIENGEGWVQLGSSEDEDIVLAVFDGHDIVIEDRESESIDTALKKADLFLKDEIIERHGECVFEEQ